MLRQRGVSLIEALVALAVMAFGMIVRWRAQMYGQFEAISRSGVVAEEQGVVG